MPPAPSTARSLLYVPGDRRDRLDGTPGRGADALILDLEDAVPAARKEPARQTVARWLGAQRADTPELWLRINAGSAGADVAACVTARVTGLVAPKATVGLLAEVDELLAAREAELGLPRGRFAVLALIETAAGLLAAPEVAAAARVVRLGLGEVDLAAELGLVTTEPRAELAPLRLQLVVASAAAGIAAPVGPTSTDFRDLDALRASTRALLRLGFRGRTAVHPAQLPVINDVFSPGGEEVEAARRLVAAYEDAQRRGTGVITDDRGRMVDTAVVRTARDVLARAERAAT
jgi:citrate lyase subunit beta / citryl-CoA lyase